MRSVIGDELNAIFIREREAAVKAREAAEAAELKARECGNKPSVGSWTRRLPHLPPRWHQAARAGVVVGSAVIPAAQT